ncbi:MAG: hypothetical protein V3W34_09135 [Phycisphaerae bacterium]
MKDERQNRSMCGMLATALVVGAGVLAMPGDARAGDWSFHIGVNRYDTPYVRTVVTRPAYEIRTRRVWVEPEYVERVVAVEIPAVVRSREIPVYDRYGNITEYRIVREVIEPARVEYQTRRVLVRRGYYRTVRERVHLRPAVRTASYLRHTAPLISVGFGHHRHKRHHHRGYGGRHHRGGLRVSFGH